MKTLNLNRNITVIHFTQINISKKIIKQTKIKLSNLVFN